MGAEGGINSSLKRTRHIMNVLFFILLLFIEMQKSTGNIYFSAISHLSDL